MNAEKPTVLEVQRLIVERELTFICPRCGGTYYGMSFVGTARETGHCKHCSFTWPRNDDGECFYITIKANDYLRKQAGELVGNRTTKGTAEALGLADRQLLAREVAADRYGGSIYTKGDFKAGWDAALEWVREQQAGERDYDQQF